MKICIAQIKTLPTRLQENARKIEEYISRADARGFELVVFPELALPGYGCMDVFRDPSFIEENLEALRSLMSFTRGKKIAAIVGFVDRGAQSHLLYNSAAVIQDGRLLQTVDKTLIPDYDVFWERRYFQSSREIRPVAVNGRKVGVEICEDLWDRDYPVKVSDELARQGAELLVNISASPFHAGKLAQRAELVKAAALRHKVPVVFANLVGAQDGYDGELVFDGRSLVCRADGRFIALGAGFEENLIAVDSGAAEPLELPAPPPEEEIYEALISGIRDYFARNGFSRAFIGLSGGVDSSVVAALAVDALGAANVMGVAMPSHITSAETLNDALLLAKNLGISCHIRPITDAYQIWEESAVEAHGSGLESLSRQNAQARIRGQILMEYSNQDRAGIVLSTGNKTELALGYCTLYGDLCGGLAVIGDVSKLMVYRLARCVNDRAGRPVIPHSVIERVPTAELAPGQTDAANLPADYPLLSPLVDEIIEQGPAAAQLASRYPQEVVSSTLKLIAASEYKRRQAPPSIRVSTKAFGAGRRYPIDNRFVA